MDENRSEARENTEYSAIDFPTNQHRYL